MTHLKKRRLLVEARMLKSHLNYEEEVQFVKKRWLMRRWPEDLNSSRSSIEDPSDCGFLGDQYILESFLRDDNSAVVMKSKIQESFDAFMENYNNYFYQSTVKRLVLEPEKLKYLSEKELFASLPVLLDHFQKPALRTLANVVTGKTCKSRKDLIENIKRGLTKLFSQTGEDIFEHLQNVKNILTNPDSFLPPCAAVLPEKPSSGLAVAKCTLAQLENLPSHTLHSMNRILGGESLKIKLEARRISASRALLAERIRNKAAKLLEGVKDFDPLPELMRKTLLVASLSARETCGEDGGIVENIGPISPEVVALHNDFLKAISRVQKLDYLDVKNIYGCLSSNDLSPSKKIYVLRCAIRFFLLEWLFECYDENVPESVMTTVKMINKLGAANGAVKERGHKGAVKRSNPKGAAIKETETKGTIKERDRKGNMMDGDPKGTIKEGDSKNILKERDSVGHKIEPRVDTMLRLDTESECVLNVSSHLRQIIYERPDYGDDYGDLEQRIAEIPLDNSEDECEPWFSENGYDTLELDEKEETYAGESFSEPEFVEVQKCGLQEQTKEGFFDGELKNSSRVDGLSKNNSLTVNSAQQIQDVCDEASLFSYRLVGSMMDEFLSRNGHLLEAPGRTYHLNGFPTTGESTGNIGSSDLQQNIDITVLLNTAMKLWPEMPSSVIENVKLSLGVM